METGKSVLLGTRILKSQHPAVPGTGALRRQRGTEYQYLPAQLQLLVGPRLLHHTDFPCSLLFLMFMSGCVFGGVGWSLSHSEAHRRDF